MSRKHVPIVFHGATHQYHYSLIELSVLKSLQAHIILAMGPEEAWNTLQKLFKSISSTKIVHLNRKFCSKYESG